MKVVFLLEERSMEEVLRVIVPQILPEHYQAVYVAHQGKSDLRNSMKIKLRSWQEPNCRFVIVHDKDSKDCLVLKKELLDEAIAAGRPDTLIRIACTELESWFLGDLRAVDLSFGLSISANQNKKKYRNPDLLSNAKQELKKLAPAYQQISGSAAIANHMNIHNNKSRSFQVFLEGLRRLVQEQDAV